MRKSVLALCATALGLLTPAAASAQDYYLGEVRWFAFGYCPAYWSQAAGQTLNVSQYQALFSLLGTTYGGNGTTTFMLPDLRGRVPVGVGQGAGLQFYNYGQKGGSETATLTYSGLPANVLTGSTPVAAAKAATGADASTIVNVPSQFAITGANQPHENMQPYLTLQACISLTGMYPVRP